MLNNKGFTMIEGLVGIALLAIIIVVGTSGYEQIQKTSRTLATLNTTENRINEIIYGVKANVTQQITSFSSSRSLSNADLPMAWSLNVDGPVAECPECPGRYGYTINAIPNYSGRYEVKLIFTHTDWQQGPKEFHFLVTQ